MDTVQYSQRQWQFNERLARILALPLRRQAACVLLAAEMALPAWKSAETQAGVDGTADRFIECFNRWLAGKASDEELDACSEPLEAALPADLTKLPDPLPGMAGFALLDVKLIALGQCEDVHADILTTAVCYAAVAALGGHPSPVRATWNNLTERQLDLLEAWWRKCSVAVPELR